MNTEPTSSQSCGTISRNGHIVANITAPVDIGARASALMIKNIKQNEVAAAICSQVDGTGEYTAVYGMMDILHPHIRQGSRLYVRLEGKNSEQAASDIIDTLDSLAADPNYQN